MPSYSLPKSRDNQYPEITSMLQRIVMYLCKAKDYFLRYIKDILLDIVFSWTFFCPDHNVTKIHVVFLTVFHSFLHLHDIPLYIYPLPY